jgi:hypothetical protein
LKSCLAALEPHTERFLENSLNGYSADMIALVAAMGGSDAVSCPMAIHSGTRIEPGINVGNNPEAPELDPL